MTSDPNNWQGDGIDSVAQEREREGRIRGRDREGKDWTGNREGGVRELEGGIWRGMVG